VSACRHSEENKHGEWMELFLIYFLFLFLSGCAKALFLVGPEPFFFLLVILDVSVE